MWSKSCCLTTEALLLNPLLRQNSSRVWNHWPPHKTATPSGLLSLRFFSGRSLNEEKNIFLFWVIFGGCAQTFVTASPARQPQHSTMPVCVTSCTSVGQAHFDSISNRKQAASNFRCHCRLRNCSLLAYILVDVLNVLLRPRRCSYHSLTETPLGNNA